MIIKYIRYVFLMSLISFSASAISNQEFKPSFHHISKPLNHKAHVMESIIKYQAANSRFESDVYQMMTFYSSQTKWWEDRNCILSFACQGHEGIWFWAHAQYLLAAYQSISGNKEFEQKLNASYADNWGRIWGRRYLDDSLWWSLALIKDYEVTHDTLALTRAESLVDFVLQNGAQNICNGDGGIYWDSTKTQVGAIANELLIVATSRLYLITHQIKYKNIANQTWIWFKGSGLINKDYTVADHYLVDNGKCGQKLDWHFSYNSGILLRALVGLYQVNNRNSEFLVIGRHVADKAMHDYTMGGVITENCTNVSACADDGFMFKGIYAYDLSEFALATKDEVFISRVRSYIGDSYHSLMANNQSEASMYPFNWALPTDFGKSSPLYNPSDVVTYLSGIYLELAYLNIMTH